MISACFWIRDGWLICLMCWSRWDRSYVNSHRVGFYKYKSLSDVLLWFKSVAMSWLKLVCSTWVSLCMQGIWENWKGKELDRKKKWFKCSTLQYTQKSNTTQNTNTEVRSMGVPRPFLGNYSLENTSLNRAYTLHYI